MTGPHPSQYSAEVLAILADLIPSGRVHDPFAGTGLRLGRLCDERGAIFSGSDIEDWPGHDPRMIVADARDAVSYPAEPFVVVTSPVYGHKRLSDYPNGPTPTTKTKGRRDYGIALDRALHPDNLARTTGQAFGRNPAPYWEEHAAAVKHWGERVLLNVDQPIEAGWRRLLEEAGYRVVEVIPAYTRRNGGFIRPNKGAGFEVVVVAEREESTHYDQ